jgi:hypothetical protein
MYKVDDGFRLEFQHTHNLDTTMHPHRIKSVAVLILSFLASLTTPAIAYDGPVIDMHMHAWPSGEDGGPELAKNKAATKAAFQSLTDNNIVLAAASGPQDFLDFWSESAPIELLLSPIFPCIDGKNPTWFRHNCFSDGGNFPDVAWLEEQYVSGKYRAMGELYNQYAGIPYNDPRMDPYYEMAQRLGIPVAFHTHSGPPRTAALCCPDFRLANGHPLLLEDVLIKYPKLRVYIMHANPLVYPEVIDLLAQYPKVYVDISNWPQSYTRKNFHRLLQFYQNAGMMGRIMFGSDMQDYETVFAAYESADFLSERQLQGIFCNNAERFLRLKGYCAKTK